MNSRNEVHRVALARGRRAWLRLAPAAIALAAWPRPAVAATADSPLPQPREATPQAFMSRAFTMRQLAADNGDQPYGAVIVHAGRIVGEAPSRVVTNGDPTAHAEVEAIRDAARRLGTRDLLGAIMYASSRPCPMCQAACFWANVGRYYFGSDIADGGPLRLTSC